MLLTAQTTKPKIRLNLSSILVSALVLGVFGYADYCQAQETDSEVETLPTFETDTDSEVETLPTFETDPDPQLSPNPTFEPSDVPPRGYFPPPYTDDQLDPNFTTYRLDIGDGISVSVPLFPEFSFVGSIDGEGNVFVPILGRLSLVGLTLEEAEAKISFELARQFLQEPPIVNAVLTSPRAARVTVLGEVIRPGFYTLEPNTNIISVLQVAGGSTTEADLRRIIVRRPLVDGTVLEQNLDLYTPLIEGNKPPQLLLRGGDTVVISRLEVGEDRDYDRTLIARSTLPQQEITVRVVFPSSSGEAIRNISVPNGSSFLDIIATLPVEDAALIDREEVALMRFDPEKNKVNTQMLNAKAAINGDIAQDVPLQDEDVIVVSRTALGKVFNAFNVITTPIRSFFGFRGLFDTLFD